ncbi:hypothetical protein [Glutamicibacter sp. TV12E]|uniref:hypothetical protein n=1 Tax=Glutamicibacter sp. TV12E TaxID=3446362 RepID=UPI004034101D
MTAQHLAAILQPRNVRLMDPQDPPHDSPPITVLDGNDTPETAITGAWHQARIQLCFLQMRQAMIKHLALRPCAFPDHKVLSLAKVLMKVATTDQAGHRSEHRQLARRLTPQRPITLARWHSYQ